MDKPDDGRDNGGDDINRMRRYRKYGGTEKCGGGQTASETGETTFGLKPFEERQELRVGYFAGSPLSLPWYIADEEGFFDELNIDVTYETYTNGTAMIEANSDWDIAGTGIGGALAAMTGYDIKTIGICDNEVNVGIFAQKDSEIAKDPKNPEVWKNSTWLYPNGTTAQPVLAAYLESLGLSLNDIKSVNMDISSALTAAIGGEGDGIGVWNAIAYEAEDNGFVRIADSGSLEIPAPCATYATDDALKNKRDLIVTSYVVFYKTWEWCKSSDENYQKATDYFLQNCEDEGISSSESVAERIMEVVQIPTLDENAAMFLDEVDDYSGTYTKRKLSTAENNFLYLLDFFIGEEKYTQQDREKILDDKMVDPEIAMEAQELMKSLKEDA